MTASLPDSCDVLVVGTGVSGLVAAMVAARQGRTALVVDSAPRWGGTTALSGGRTWIPMNGHPENHGDSRERALAYLLQVFGEEFPEHIDAFLDTVNEAADFVEANSPHRFVVCPNYPDYHPHLEGATTGGRCFDVNLVSSGDLVPEAAQVLQAPTYVPMTHAEWESWRLPARIDRALLARRRSQGILTGGPGMVASLVHGAVTAGAVLRSETELEDILTDAHGVCGALLRYAGRQHAVRTRAVVLATGGYDADQGLRNELMPRALAVTASAPTNTGIALAVADRHELATANLGNGWWMPMVEMPGERVLGASYPRGLIRERGVPRLIVVNGSGQRCLDEALPYNEFGKEVHRLAPDGSAPNLVTWVVVDEGFREKYSLPGLVPGEMPPAHIRRSATLEGLAAQMRVPSDVLRATVERWNAQCAFGKDKDFAKGENAYDRYYGDPFAEGHSNIGPLDQPPYYALRVWSGCISSKGGPVTTTDGVAVRRDGSVLSGLYVVGTAAAFWTSDGYPGPGTPIALGLSGGYRAGRHVVEQRLVEGASRG